MDIQERKKYAKKKGATRLYRNYCIKNIYYIDLIDFSSKKVKWIQNCINSFTNFNKNNGYKYVLVCVDGYSRYTMIRKLKNKSADTVCKAMEDIIDTYGKPNHICCDEGSEFVNSTFRSMLEKNNIQMYHMYTLSKSIFAERTIRTLKEYMMGPFNTSKGRWVNAIDIALKKHNNKINEYTGYTPVQIFKENYVYTEDIEPENMSTKDTTQQFNIGDYVRIFTPPSLLDKKSLTYKWSENVYKIIDIDKDPLPIMYELDCDKKRKKYYHWELLLSKCKPVEKSIIKTRKQSEKTPEGIKKNAQRHKPVTRGVKKDYSKYRQLTNG